MAFVSVLLVDDDRATLDLVRSRLQAAGHAVDAAANGRQALQRIGAAPPDLLITKLLMPDGDGIELITAVKCDHPGVRIIAVSDQRFLGGLDLLGLARTLGADAVLDSPSADEVLAAASAMAGAPD